MNKKRIEILLVLVFIFSLSCVKESRREKEEFRGGRNEIPVRVLRIKRMARDSIISFSGTVLPENFVFINPQVQGEVEKIFIDIGMKVKRGDVLVKISDFDFRVAVSRARANYKSSEVQLAQAKIDFERANKLFMGGAIPQAEFDKAKTNYELARSRLDEAKSLLSKAEQDLKETEVKAPFDGVIVEKRVEKGMFVSPQTPMFALQGYKNYFLGKIPEKDIFRISVGQKVTVDIPPLKREYQGIIKTIKPSSDTLRRGFEVKIDMNTGRETLSSNLLGVAKIRVLGDMGVYVPYESVGISSEFGEYVFEVSNGLLRRVSAKIIDRTSNFVVLDIPQSVTQIVAEVNDNMADNMKVRIVEVLEE